MLALTLKLDNKIVLDVPPSTTPQRVEIHINPSRKIKKDRVSVLFDAPLAIDINREESQLVAAPRRRARNPRRVA